MLSPALTLSVLLAAEPTPIVEPPAATEPGAVLVVEGPTQVRALCDALAPPERAVTRGDAMERSRALEDRAARREAALGRRYRVRLAADHLAFEPYDRDERQLVLSDRNFLQAFGGVLHVWTVEDAGLPVRADPSVARRIVTAAARRTLSLTLTFALPEDDDVTCAHPAGSRAYALGVEPYRWEYAEGDEVLARGGEGGDRPVFTLAQGALPRVEISEPLGDPGGSVRAAVAARRPELQRCYLRALGANPGLDGAVVAELQLPEGGGTPSEVRVAVDSVQDDAMTGCVRTVLAQTTFPNGGGAAAVPIHFELEVPEPREASNP